MNENQQKTKNNQKDLEKEYSGVKLKMKEITELNKWVELE